MLPASQPVATKAIVRAGDAQADTRREIYDAWRRTRFMTKGFGGVSPSDRPNGLYDRFGETDNIKTGIPPRFKEEARRAWAEARAAIATERMMRDLMQ